ncbi:TetR/AcrR family transcriptional regulator [Nocardia sp. NPDC003693]
MRQAVENGSAAVTVDSICAEALVSARTFYNYFPTRDAVLAGQKWESIPPEAAERFSAAESTDMLEPLVTLFVDSGPQTAAERELFQLRQRLFELEPGWAQQAMAGFTECVEDVVALVLARWEGEGRSPATEPDLPALARMSVMIVGSILHTGMLDAQPPGTDEPESPDQLIMLARKAIQNLIT